MQLATIVGFVGWIVIITAIITGLRLGKGKKGRGIRTLQLTASCFFIFVFVGSFFVMSAQGEMDFLAFLLFAALLILPILGLRGFIKWYKSAPAAEEQTSQTEKQTPADSIVDEAEKLIPLDTIANKTEKQMPVDTGINDFPPPSPDKDGTPKCIRHIVCLCWDAPYINSLTGKMQNYIVNAEQSRGNIITPTSRISFDSFYDNASLDDPFMIRSKIAQLYSNVYDIAKIYELADQSVPREVLQKDGHTLVKYYVLYESEPPTLAASVELPGSAEPCAWAQDAEAAKLLSAIQKTWGVEVKPYRISEADARALESAQPMVLPTGVEQAQYAVEQSSNSVHWHPYGSWVDFKHTKFLYQGKLYYVNVCPTVQLTESMYNRSGDLSNMAKIMIVLNKQAGPDRDQLVFVLEGNLHDQT